jgi:hypothetical protein
MDSSEKAILKTLLYSNLFDYPLTKEEIFDFLIMHKITKRKLVQSLSGGKIPGTFYKGFYLLDGNKQLVAKRQTRELISSKKLEKARAIIKKLSVIPTIKLIGISGTLAMKNCEVDDDIDIFIIAEKHFAWTTRFLTAIFLIILGAYRNKHSKKYQDKICLNLILDEARMSFEKQDLFTAHEIVQLLPIFERNGTYRKFLNVNLWVKKFLPNWQVKHKTVLGKQRSFLDGLIIAIFGIACSEKILKMFQLFYMRKAVTRERLEKDFIGLHPFDYREYILKKYNTEIGKFGLR